MSFSSKPSLKDAFAISVSSKWIDELPSIEFMMSWKDWFVYLQVSERIESINHEKKCQNKGKMLKTVVVLE